jgi:hypothetical protein
MGDWCFADVNRMGWRIADYVSDGIWPSQSGNTINGGEL